MTVQLAELRGLIKIVPPLIDADRERRWEEIGNRPGDLYVGRRLFGAVRVGEPTG
jgi:hypothetical protein